MVVNIAPTAAGNSLCNIKAVFFDLDGTLVESGQLWYALYNDAAKRFQIPPLQWDAFQRLFGQSAEVYRDAFFGSSVPLPEFIDHISTHYVDFMHLSTMLEGVMPLLRSLKERFQGRLAICTNCTLPIARRQIRQIGLNEIFNDRAIFGARSQCDGAQHCDECPLNQNKNKNNNVVQADHASLKCPEVPSKPDPEMLLRACRLYGLHPSQCMFVGDSSSDVKAGVAAGTYTVGIGVEGGNASIGSIVELGQLLGL